MIAKIREEGLQRSGLPNTFSYMTDVIGARLTNSDDMVRAQEWVVGEMRRMGLENVERGALHGLRRELGQRVRVPAHARARLLPDGRISDRTYAGTNGRSATHAVIGDVHTRSDLERYRGKLEGLAVLSTPPAIIDQSRFETGTPRRTDRGAARSGAGTSSCRPPGPDPYFLAPLSAAASQPRGSHCGREARLLRRGRRRRSPGVEQWLAGCCAGLRARRSQGRSMGESGGRSDLFQ